ncbi:MAG: glycyl-radical enzyme activating protein [Anaerolineae bacterium]
MSGEGIVFDIKRFSIHDGPGIRTTVFLKGCPLSCWWCHNPEGQAEEPELILRPDRCIGCGACLDVCEREAIVVEGDVIVTQRERCTACGVCVEVCYTEARELVGRPMTVAQVMDEIERDGAFYDQSGGGVTFSGGEPLAQPHFLRVLLRACKERGVHTALDTCGFASWNELDGLREDVDLFLYDLKLMDDVRHRESTGVSNEPILENLQRLSGRRHRIVLRVPIIPGINDDEENLGQIGRFARGLPSLEGVDLLPYHSIWRDKHRGLGKVRPMPDAQPPSDGRMDEIAQTLRRFDLAVNIGG